MANDTYVLSAHWSNEDHSYINCLNMADARRKAAEVLDDPFRDRDRCYLLSLNICDKSGLILETVYSIWDPDAEQKWKLDRAEEAHFHLEADDYYC